MGPRSDNRGYGRRSRHDELVTAMLQWVHGPITVVMQSSQWHCPCRLYDASMGPRSDNRGYGRNAGVDDRRRCVASMGPRSDNRGYASTGRPQTDAGLQLQWVHGPITVVMASVADRGAAAARRLQWVHGPITVVMVGSPAMTADRLAASMGPRSDNRGYGAACRDHAVQRLMASMGPRSDNRGYGRSRLDDVRASAGFNGSTVR